MPTGICPVTPLLICSMIELTTRQEAIACAKVPSLPNVKKTSLAVCPEGLMCLPSAKLHVQWESAMISGKRPVLLPQLLMFTYLQ